MVHSEWLDEGDEVFSSFMAQDFRDMIDFISEKKLREQFRDWQKAKKEGL